MSALTADAAGDHLSRRDFARLATFIEKYSGIKMPQNKLTMVEGRLRKRVRATGMRNVTEYCGYLFDDGGLDREEIHLIDAMTTNKTDFFREPEHFRVLTRLVLPEIVSERPCENGKPVKLWSVACSTGAEPYTLAMVVADFARSAKSVTASILATDICSEALDKAVQGVYPKAMVEPVPPDARKRYVMKSRDAAKSIVRIIPELREMIGFGRLNLMDSAYPVDRNMDVIFCRNILIYFDRPTQEAVLNRLCDHLRTGGYLFLGHSESPAGFQLPLQPAGNTVFRKV